MRPVLIGNAELPYGVSYNVSINPWKEFFEDPRVFEKIKHFRNLRCDLKVKVVVNGNPFYYGSYIMYYQPLHTFDTRTSNVALPEALIQYSQMPHVYIDPCEGTGGEISIPYFYNKDAMNIIERDWNDMGLIHIRDIFPLQHSNDNTEPIDISVFAMAYNVSLSTPTSRVPVENQADEYGKPSAVAHSVAKAAGWFEHIPVIGKYARATQMLMTAAGDMAALFGYSRPREIEEAKSVRQRPAGNLAVVNVADNIASLALDAKKEVTIDPRVVGLSSTDEMAIQPIAMRESFVTLFPWSETASADTHLFSIRVNPVNGAATQSGNNYLTPSAFVSLPFRYWRGTMRFRFNIIASKYHRGRLKFVWDPDFNGPQSGPNYNSNYITIVDINQQKDVSLDIGWGSNFSYLETGGFPLQKHSLTPFLGPSRWANGTLSVFVVNSLTSPGPTNSDVAVSVFSSMCDDFEVACPDPLFLEGDLSLRSSPIPPPVPRPPIDGDDGQGPNLPPVPVDPTVPDEPLPEDVVETIIPDGIGFGNRRLWPNPPMDQGSRVRRDNGQIDIPGANTGVIFMIPPAGGAMRFSIYSSLARDINIIHYEEDGVTIIQQNTFTTFAEDTSTFTLSLWDNELINQKYQYIRIIGTDNANLLRLVDFEMDGVVFLKQTAEQLNARLASGPLTYDVDGKASFDFLNETDKLLFNAPPGLTSLNNGPIVHYMLEGPSGAVHRYNNVNRAPGADSFFKFAVADELIYDSPGTVAITVGNTAAKQLTGFTFDGAIFMYYPNAESQALLVENQAEEHEIDEAAAPVSMSADERMAPKLPGMEVNSVYFGEQITSWRQVLKRYETISTISNIPTKVRWHDSFTELAPVPGLIISRLSMVDYVKSAYVGARGGMRLKLMPLTNFNNLGAVVISNVSDAQRDQVGPKPPSWAGSTYEPLAVTGVADAEIPYYSNLRFFFSRLSAGEYSGASGRSPREGLQRLEAFINFYGGDPNGQFALAQAVAEDYSLHFFLSAPVLWFQPPPVTNPPFG